MDVVDMFVDLQVKDNVTVVCVTEYTSRSMTDPSHEESASLKNIF